MQADKTITPETTACKNCGKSEFLQLFTACDFDTGRETFSLKQCTSCKLTCTFPMLTDSQLGRYYQTEYYGKGSKKFSAAIEKWTIHNNIKLARNILRSFKKRNGKEDGPARILDIGCGRGNLLKAFNTMGFECHGIERTEFPDQTYDAGITIHKTSLRDVKFDDNVFDIVVIWHVLEHLSDPGDIIKEISRILRSTGILVIAVPNFGSFQSRLFRRHWFHLDLPRHLYHFEKSSLDNLLTKHQLTITEFDTRAFDQSVYGFIQSALNCIPWFKSNSFYEQLKLPWPARKLNFYLQVVLATALLPFALIDYYLAALSHQGSCLILTATKQTGGMDGKSSIP